MIDRVLEHQAEIFEMKRVAERALDADIGGDADEDERADSAGAQNAVHIGVEEAAVARLGDEDVARLRLQLVDDRVVPAALGEELALELRPGPHCLQRVRLVPVGRARPAGFDIACVPAVLEMHDGDAGRASGVEHLADLADDLGGLRHVEAGDVHIAALRRVGVLHVDHDDRGLGGFERQRFGARRHDERIGGVAERIAGMEGSGHQTAASSGVGAPIPARHFISGWMRVPNSSTPLMKSSKVSSTPSQPGTVATSSSSVATVS